MTAMQSGLPTDVLELRAAEQRRQIHNSVSELRDNLRETLDVRRHAREYVWSATGVAGLLGLALGYMFAGVFTD